MRRHQTIGWLYINITLVVVFAGGSASAANLRTTSIGKAVSRQAHYVAPLETAGEVATVGATMPTEAPIGKGYAMEDDWIGPDDPACCGPTVGACGYWGGFEFLLWWRHGQDLPALLTTSSAGTPIEDAGVLGNFSTQVLYGEQTLGEDASPGGRLTIGKWLDGCQILGVGTRLYSLGDGTANFDTNSDQYPILARPFFNTTLSRDDSDVIAYPEVSTGNVSISNTADVAGGDIFFRRLFFADCYRRVDLVAGYQFARINQDLSISTSRTSIDPQGSIPVGTVVDVGDLFTTKNEYHAGHVGFLTEVDRGCWTLSLLAKVGLGKMREQVTINGQTEIAIPGQAVTTNNQGLLALDSNSGSFSQSVFAVSPEVSLSAAYHMTDAIDLTFGYSFIHWNRVAQAASQIDTTINTSQVTGDLVGEARPAFDFEETGYFVQGLNVGVTWVY